MVFFLQEEKAREGIWLLMLQAKIFGVCFCFLNCLHCVAEIMVSADYEVSDTLLLSSKHLFVCVYYSTTRYVGPDFQITPVKSGFIAVRLTLRFTGICS